jgi:phosphate starvation-inducible PhoH-like protein
MCLFAHILFITPLIKKEFIIDSAQVDPAMLWGPMNKNLKLLQKAFGKLKLVGRGNSLTASGESDEIDRLEQVLRGMETFVSKYGNITEARIMTMIEKQSMPAAEPETETIQQVEETPELLDKDVILHGNGGKVIKARTPNQKAMVKALQKNDILFAIGPAGTGKTYTAVAMAVRALKNKEIKRIILARPAVEAGENLGFLPGDLKEKIDPYLRPLYDALDDMIAAEKLKQFIENRTIEIAPMAFMRGRTLDHAYVILDEAQNATDLQLKMFLTRMGPNAKFIITGDLTQIDLPKRSQSGLLKAVNILDGIAGINFCYLTFEDVIRHKLVKDIIKAYDHFSHPEQL